MKNSATTKNSSKYTEDWLPIKSIANGAILLDNKLKVTGVKIKPRNIFILDQGTQDNTIIALKNFYNTIDFEFWLISADRPVDLNNYFIIYVLSTLLGNLSLWMYLPKFVQKVKIKELNLFRHVKPTIMLFIPQVATQIYTVLDKTMIGVIVSNKAEVGYYEQAQKIVKLLMTLATSLGTVMMPRIAATFASGNHEKVREYMNKSFHFILLLAFPLMFGIISVSSSFVPIFYGKGYDKVIPLLCVISPIIVLIGLSNITGTQYLLPTKKQNQYTLSVVVGAIVNFILNLILIKYFASIGASIATVIAELAVTSIQFILVRKEIKFIDVIKLSYKYVIGSLIMFMCSMIVGYFIKDNLVSIILQVIVSFFVYFLVLYILKDKMINEVVVRFKSKIRKEGK